MDQQEEQQRMRFVIELGRALHQCGASSQRIETHLTNVTRMLGLNGQFLFSPTGFTCVFWTDDAFDQKIHIERVSPGDLNLGRLWMIDDMVESMERGNLGLAQAMVELARLENAPPLYPPFMHGCGWALTGGSFAALLSGDWNDVIASAFLSMMTFLLFLLSTRHQRLSSLLTIVAPFLSGLLSQLVFSLGLAINVPFVSLSSILVFIPGLSLTVAMSEISARQLISGSSRLVEAMMNLLLLLFGAIMGISLASWLRQPAEAIVNQWPMGEGKNWPSAMLLSMSLTVAFNIPWRKAVWGMIACALAYGVSQSIGQSFGMIAGMFVGAMAVGLFSNAFARISKAPSSVISTQGIILLVPGSTTYMILNQWIAGTAVLPTVTIGSQALMLFVALVAGLLFANALLPPGKSL
jgi:uncharacterized membrane protein YjjP (DUF1212 family)